MLALQNPPIIYRQMKHIIKGKRKGYKSCGAFKIQLAQMFIFDSKTSYSFILIL